MILDDRRKELFDDAYDAYLKISKIIENLYEDPDDDPVAEGWASRV